ncbi:hypothetical protein Tco_0373289, partial [Tanacetum coccineum]
HRRPRLSDEDMKEEDDLEDFIDDADADEDWMAEDTDEDYMDEEHTDDDF